MSNKKYDVRHKYDSTADRYDTRYSDIQMQKYFEIFSEIKLVKSGTIIDVGGGTGLFLDYLQSKKLTTVITDISVEMLKEGRKKNPHGFFVCADSEYLPLRKNIGDLITCISVIQNLENPQKTLEECYFIIKKDKHFVLTALKKLFDLEKLCKIVEKIGFNIIKTWLLSLEDITIIAGKE
ncbi:MAG: Ubiquinone/menaquinone biosynthesis C-methyltransferase UbiE [Candidatus Heimdallarchaeota archaeon AB_125]|nr:MAG: Ubiquinone/menaquinone biosynthesis C-methyltransferase UbiE [Candidatus Heimdallarchaeota archaeon AB_125]